jgi:hypothetical protein
MSTISKQRAVLCCPVVGVLHRAVLSLVHCRAQQAHQREAASAQQQVLMVQPASAPRCQQQHWQQQQQAQPARLGSRTKEGELLGVLDVLLANLTAAHVAVVSSAGGAASGMVLCVS